jgi:hypothetical protein
MPTWRERRAQQLRERQRWARLPHQEKVLILASLNGRRPPYEQLELWDQTGAHPSRRTAA